MADGDYLGKLGMPPFVDFTNLLDQFGFSSGKEFTAEDFAQTPRFRTENTTTVFSGTAQEWTEYLGIPWNDRRDETLFIRIEYDQDRRTVRFHARNEESRRWADWLTDGLEILRSHLGQRPVVMGILEQMLYGNASNGLAPIHLHFFQGLPSSATREIKVDDHLRPLETDIVLKTELVRTVGEAMRSLPRDADEMTRMGTLWPVLRRVIQQLAYPSYPRDRFLDRIELTAKVTFLSLHVLFESRSSGKLKPTRAGAIYMKFIARSVGVPEKQLFDRHPYFRMFNDLGFLLSENRFEQLRDTTRIIVRDYLDPRYLRLSLAAIMPDSLPWMCAMRADYKKDKIVTPAPKKGAYGILNEEDLDAWKQVSSSLRDTGYIIVRQLGIGQFGRVYEAIVQGNSAIPQRVAIKVDRIGKGKKKEAIQAAETIMDIGRQLSQSPHVIRIFDAGKLKKNKYTYHVIQLVEGDTLDDLIGVTGNEHSSIHRPEVARTNLRELRDEYLKSLRESTKESWRREHTSLPFTDPLTLPQLLDILVSKLLWLEEAHRIGFAINDLKNGNLMISRRGALKGIDLDSYSPIFSPLDKLTDFFFLAVSSLLFVLSCMDDASEHHIHANELLTKPDRFRELILSRWPFGPIEQLSDGRVHRAQVVETIIELMEDARTGVYAHEPEKFTAMIDRIIFLKRSITVEEIILD